MLTLVDVGHFLKFTRRIKPPDRFRQRDRAVHRHIYWDDKYLEALPPDSRRVFVQEMQGHGSFVQLFGRWVFYDPSTKFEVWGPQKGRGPLVKTENPPIFLGEGHPDFLGQP